MLKLITSLLATGLIIASGVLHGIWTHRWGEPPELAAAAKRLKTVPMTIGEWEGEDLEHAESRPDLGIAGSLQRRYVNQRNGQVVLIALVCGEFGPVSIHDPATCYAASGFTVDKPQRENCPGGSSFKMANAVRVRATEKSSLRVYWSWNGGAGWVTPEEPRHEFAQKKLLHKLYVLRERGDLDTEPAVDPCKEFMKVLLPTLDQVLFSEGEIL